MSDNNMLLLTMKKYLLNMSAHLICSEMRKLEKKKYSAKWLLRRESEGFGHKLSKELMDEDTKLFKTLLKMTPVQFEFILKLVTPRIQKKDTTFRNAITPAERLQVTLTYLATGATQSFLQVQFRIQQSTISKIIKETVTALFEVVKNEYLKFPQNEDDWLKISQEFYDLWGFPHCIGAIDGKYCKIKPLKSFGSNYWCYKGFHSFILMAIADARYRFIYVDVGVNGRIGDACLWVNSDLKQAIEASNVKIPPPANFPKTTIKTPYTLISDDAFPLKHYIMKPYSHMPLSEDEFSFNYMLSRNRRVVENAFGILANRFQVLFSPIFREPYEAMKIVLAAVCLHNFLRTEAIKTQIDQDILTEQEIDSTVAMNYDDYILGATSTQGRKKKSAVEIRETLKEYFKTFKGELN